MFLLILLKLAAACFEIRAVIFKETFICFHGLCLQIFLRLTLAEFLLSRVDLKYQFL